MMNGNQPSSAFSVYSTENNEQTDHKVPARKDKKAPISKSIKHISKKAGIMKRNSMRKKKKLKNADAALKDFTQKHKTAKHTDPDAEDPSIELSSSRSLVMAQEKEDDEVENSSFTSVSRKNNNTSKMPLPTGNGEKDGRALFQWMIHPYPIKKFFKLIWEQKPLLVRRHDSNYAQGVFSTVELNRILEDNDIQYGVHLDITTYQNETRETLNIPGRAYPPVVWDFYKNGCSVRLRNPQMFAPALHSMCSSLQEHFKATVGGNIYLTPAGTQGFAPHYDDIEAFVLQLEGKKRWRIYNPPADQTLPRFSSGNFKQNEIGDMIFSTVLEPGDILYFPRGYIHQAEALPDVHSMHITFSTYQKHTWGDVMEKIVGPALKSAIENDVEFRRGLPLDFMDLLGVQNSNSTNPRRQHLFSKVRGLFSRLAEHADVDGAADQHAKSYMHLSLPPCLTEAQKKCSISNVKVGFNSTGQPHKFICDLSEQTKVRLLQKNCVRICMEENNDKEDAVTVYHNVQNPLIRIHAADEAKYFEISADAAMGIDYLLDTFPAYVAVSSIPLPNNDQKMSLATTLFENGVLLTESPITMLSTDQVQ